MDEVHDYDAHSARPLSRAESILTLSPRHSPFELGLEDDELTVTNVCGFDLAVIRDHCLCQKCKYFFKDRPQSDLLAIFSHTCLGCPIRTQGEEGFSTPPTSELQGNSNPLSPDEIIDDLLVCCLEKNTETRHYLEDPIVLPCLHSFCDGCLRQELQNQSHNIPLEGNNNSQEQDTIKQFVCPVKGCDTSTEVKISQEGKVMTCQNERSLLKSMVDNYTMEKRMINGEEVCDFEKGKAIAECVDCRVLTPLCEQCLSGHQLSRGTGNHRIIYVDKLKDLSSAERFSHYKAPKCDKHRDSHLCMYCQEHNVVVCIKCAMESEHQSCKNKFDVVAHFNDDQARPHRKKFAEMKEEVQLLHTNITVASKCIQLKIDELTQCCDAITEDINNRSQALKEEIEKQRRRLVSHSQRIYQLKLDDLRTHLEMLRNLETKVGDNIQWIEAFQLLAIPVGFFLFKKKMEDRMSSLLEYRMHYQEDDLLMNEKVYHKKPWSFENVKANIVPFCIHSFGQVYSTPCLKKFTIKPGNPLTLVCRDIHGTALHAHLPDIKAKLVIQDLHTEMPSRIRRTNVSKTTIECTVVKHRKKGVYNVKTRGDIQPGQYTLLISNKNPAAYFDYEEHGKKFELSFSRQDGFQLIS